MWVIGERSGEGRRRNRKKRGGKGVWTEEGRKKFFKYLGKRREGEGIEKSWRSLKKRIEESLRRVEKKLKRRKKGDW